MGAFTMRPTAPVASSPLRATRTPLEAPIPQLVRVTLAHYHLHIYIYIHIVYLLVCFLRSRLTTNKLYFVSGGGGAGVEMGIRHCLPQPLLGIEFTQPLIAHSSLMMGQSWGINFLGRKVHGVTKASGHRKAHGL
jgi:hypothetical protein